MGWILPIFLVLFWQAASSLGIIQAEWLPAPLTIAHTLYELGRSGELWGHIGVTVLRVLIGFVIGAAAGTAAGLEPRRPPVRTTVFSPLFTVELQNGDVVWATFGNGEPAVVFRPGKVPTLFCGTPNLPQGIYRAFLKMCHAPFPVSDPAFTVANPPYFMTSILDTGRYLFSPSEEPSRKWSELAPGTVSAQSAPLIRRFRKGEVLLLKEEK